MRFGWLMAAAAMVCAVPAGAANYIKYAVSGVGTLDPENLSGQSLGTPQNNQAFDAFFEVLASPGSAIDIENGTVLTSDGTTFSGHAGSYGFNGAASAAVPGVLTYSERYAQPGGGVNSSLSVNYTAGGSGFPTYIGAGPVTGSFAFSLQSYPSNYSFTGNITSFSVVGTVNDFKQITFGAVPEPTLWLLMIVGFGMVGTASRSARKRNINAFS